jgi:hypothetical protein
VDQLRHVHKVLARAVLQNILQRLRHNGVTHLASEMDWTLGALEYCVLRIFSEAPGMRR